MINNCIAFSNSQDSIKAFDEVRNQIDSKGNPCLIIFSAPVEGFAYFTGEFKKAYPAATIVGVTTVVCFCNLGYVEGGLSTLAVFDGIEYSSGVILETTRYPMRYASKIDDAVKKLSDTENTVCIEFSTAQGKCEELIQDTYRNALEHRGIQVAGGTAGGPAISSKTYVSLDGIVYGEASVFVLIKNLGGRIITYKENIYKPTKHHFMATDVDCDERTVYEYDDRPAAETLALMLGVDVAHLKEALFLKPVGRITGKDLYITDVDKIMPDGSISYFARIYNRTRLVLMEMADIEKVWNETAANIQYEIEKPSMTVAINCYGRTKYFMNTGRFEAFNDKLTCEYGNFVGVSGFGEQINYEHFNKALVLAVFE